MEQIKEYFKLIEDAKIPEIEKIKRLQNLLDRIKKLMEDTNEKNRH